MDTGDDAEQARQDEILTWHKLHDHILHNDRAAVDIGVFALKVVMTINAGALIALLAAMESLKGAPGASAFFFGLMTAAGASLLSYIYQSSMTAAVWREYHIKFPEPGREPPYKWATATSKLIWVVIAMVLASYVAFGYGTWAVISSMPAP